ncbi:MAG: hypothetical protein LBV72_13825 [Tannerella sp.]|nr:hypothetical protein [Tannerella sp.]
MTTDKNLMLNEANIEQYAKTVNTAETDSQYSISDNVNFPFTSFAGKQATRLIEGDCHIKSLVVSKQDWCPFNLIVNGNLTVDEDIDWAEWGSGSFLVVTGNLHVRNLFMSGCPEVVVLGDLIADNGIVGSRGDNGGMLTVLGRTKAQAMLCTTYFGMEFASRPEAFIIADSRDFKFDVDLDETDYDMVAKAIDPVCFPEEEGIIEEDEFKDLLREGKSVLKK